MRGVALSAALLLVPLQALAEDAQPPQTAAWMFGRHEDWLACQSYDQCAIITTPCKTKLAVNRDYRERANKYAARHDVCLSTVYPENTITGCVNNQCVLMFPKDDK